MPSVKRQTQEDYDIAEPRASAMIKSLRAFGYNIQTAIADLKDLEASMTCSIPVRSVASS